MARRLHPDRAASTGPAAPGPRPTVEGSMAAVNEAYRVLSDAARRVVYDRSLDGAAGHRTGAASTPGGDAPVDVDGFDGFDVERPPAPMPPNRLSPAGPARVPWRVMGAVALLGSGVVLVSSFFDESPATQAPDGIIQPGSCVAFEINGDAREVACGSGNDIVVRSLVPLDAVCPGGTVGHRDRLGLGVACVAG